MCSSRTAAIDEVALRCAGAQNDRRRRDLAQAPDQPQPVLALPFAAAGPIGDDDDVRAACRRHVRRTRQLRREALDGRGLHQVERLALGHASAIVDQTNRGGRVTPRERVSERAAKLAGADDGDIAHQWAIVRDNDRCERLRPLIRRDPQKAHMSESLSGKVAIVTGGSRGIGLAIARALAADGAHVSITGRDESHLSAARPLIEKEGPGSVETLQADVRRYDEVERAVAATVARFGGLDFLINNAGVGIFANVADMTPAQWSEVIDTNLTGVFYACHAAIPHLRRRGGGFIINISSLAGKNAFPMAAAYCATKSGLNAFSEALMQEVRYDNIRVSYVMPGSVATGFMGGDESKGADWKVSADEVAEVVLNLLHHPARSLPSRVELRPTKPPRK